ncbi:MAG: biopolymer transporter ExbD [Chitinivibrionales bacterium]|nr:biopolymer transporter ExbD [Chitinivibrionales bacterium]
MINKRSLRSSRRKRGDGTVKLNITSMIDMFTLMVVFLLKNYSAQGQLVTPAAGLMLPTSTIEKTVGEALSVKVSRTSITVENTLIIDSLDYKNILAQKDFMIQPLYAVLHRYAAEAQKSAKLFKTDFSGRISIQGDVAIPYNVLTRVMYTCGQAGYPVMNLVVYRKA